MCNSKKLFHKSQFFHKNHYSLPRQKRAFPGRSIQIYGAFELVEACGFCIKRPSNPANPSTTRTLPRSRIQKHGSTLLGALRLPGVTIGFILWHGIVLVCVFFGTFPQPNSRGPMLHLFLLAQTSQIIPLIPRLALAILQNSFFFWIKMGLILLHSPLIY